MEIKQNTLYLTTQGSYVSRDHLNLKIEVEQEDDGRWIAEVPSLPGCLIYGQSQTEAIAKVKALALRVMADRMEHGEAVPVGDELFSMA